MKKARAVYFDRQDEYDRCKETNNNQLFHSSSSSSSSSEHSKQIAANHLSIVSPSPLHLHRTVSSPPTLPANDDLKRREKDILEKDLRTKLYDSEMYLKSCLTDLNTKRSEVLNTKYDSITTLNKLIINTENVINHVLYDYFDMLYALYTQLPKPYESDILKFIDQNKQSYLVYLKNLPLSSSEHDYLHYENYISLPQSLIVGDEQIKSTQSYQECDEFVRQQKSKTIENNCTTAYLPSIVQQCCSAIEKMSGQYIKGIYRISSVKSKVDQLCRELRNGKLISENELINDYSPNVLANVIKKCLRELSSPLLLLGKDKSIDCYSLYKDFMSVAKELYTFNDSTNSNITSLVEKLEKIIHERLSDDARLTLHCLLKHLKYISSYEDENQMSTSNLGIIFGPTLFKTENLTEDDTISTLLDAPYQAKLVEFLIDNVEELYQNVDEQHKQVDSSNSQ
ncbi:unnamed protein product [Didymodactylos carnosus]|nr:unnamed protein product [Didymodactylos carnosus]CAF4355946.1 unnamed protein product [Didymodactylos carnosus]